VASCFALAKWEMRRKGGSRVTALRWMNRRVVEPNPAPRGLITAMALFLLRGQTGFAFAQSPGKGQAATVRVDATPGHAINSFDPDSALGSSIDVLSRTEINKVYTPHIIQEALWAGWGPITYRNNTELRMAAWHWTENGAWSDPGHRSGYFTSNTE